MGEHPDICGDAGIFPAIGTCGGVWENVKESGDLRYHEILHIHHARNSPDASADGGLLWTLLSVRNQDKEQ